MYIIWCICICVYNNVQLCINIVLYLSPNIDALHSFRNYRLLVLKNYMKLSVSATIESDHRVCQLFLMMYCCDIWHMFNSFRPSAHAFVNTRFSAPSFGTILPGGPRNHSKVMPDTVPTSSFWKEWIDRMNYKLRTGLDTLLRFWG